MEIEAASGIMLVIATIVALVWANSGWSGLYHDLLELHLVIEFGDLSIIDESVEHLINDGLVAIFFFVVGLEIKRELVSGELRDPRAAALPSIAAIGGMIVPAGIYFALNPSGPGSDGWGIPMATDIAFALGIMSLLGKRVPNELKLFLLTLAIVDDLGAIAVIAIFYTASINLTWLLIGIGLLVALFVAQRMRIWYPPFYVTVGIVIWYSVLESGVHATIAGVALGLLTPATPLVDPKDRQGFGVAIEPDDLSADSIRRAQLHMRESVSVAERLETAIHPFSSFVILPIFALANAGIELSGEALGNAASSTVTLGIVIGLVAGKTIGVSVASWIAVRSGFCTLPSNVTWPMIVAVAMMAGIGFTVALFITGLAFDGDALNVFDTEARMGILAASLAAAIGGLALLRWATKDEPVV